MENGKKSKSHKPQDSSIPDVIDSLLSEVAAKGKQALGEVVSETSDVMSNKFSKIKKKASEWGLDEMADEVKTYVKKNPMKGVGIAVGLGLLAGLLIKSGSRRSE